MDLLGSKMSAHPRTQQRRAAELAGRVTSLKDSVASAVQTFDRTLPQLSLMRNVGEHIDDVLLIVPNGGIRTLAGRHFK